jgi:hypothetical protein
MTIEIRKTIVTPTADGDLIQLHISDAPPDDESATFVLQIVAKMPPLEPCLLAQMQREAMTTAQDALTPILQDLAAQITQGAGRPLRPRKVAS